MPEIEAPGQLKYPTLFSPLKIGNITVRNRIMQSAHAKGWHKKEGLTNNRDRYYAEARAKGGEQPARVRAQCDVDGAQIDLGPGGPEGDMRLGAYQGAAEGEGVRA